MTSDPAAQVPADFSRIEDRRLWEAVAGARRVRLFARLAGLAVAVTGLVLDLPGWLLGAFLGWLLVEVNLDFLVRTLVRAPLWRGRSLWPTLLGFYLLFGATGLACFVIIRQHWGHPLAFLLGLLTFFAGLVVGLFSLALKRPEPPA